MAIPSLNGLIWRSQWNAPGEGPYSILAKLIHANSVPPSHFRDVIRWKRPAGASLLFPRPQQSANERIASLGRLLQDSSLSRLARYMHGELAGDQALRYCRTCMSTGFQAAIAQIDGLDVCPIHKEPHLSSCVRCGARTPPYYLGNSDRLPQFSCWKCGAPFGDGALIERRFDAWGPPERLHRLDSIHRWLSKIEDYWCISWPSVSVWETTRFLDEGKDEHRRRAVFAVLSTLVPDSGVPSPKFEPNIEIFGPFHLANDQPSGHLAQMACPVARPLPPGDNLGEYRRNLRTPSFGVPVPDSPIVPPAIHAQLIWRAQFEGIVDIVKEQAPPTELASNAIADLLAARLTIPSRALTERNIVRGILAATWLAAVRIAAEWHQLLVAFRNTCITCSADDWFIACSRWAHRLGCWRNHGYFPVGAVIARDLGSGEPRLYFAVA